MSQTTPFRKIPPSLSHSLQARLRYHTRVKEGTPSLDGTDRTKCFKMNEKEDQQERRKEGRKERRKEGRHGPLLPSLCGKLS